MSLDRGADKIYESRNTIVHEGRLIPTIFDPRPNTHFIEQALLKPTLTWFSEHLEAELTELDTRSLKPTRPQPTPRPSSL